MVACTDLTAHKLRLRKAKITCPKTRLGGSLTLKYIYFLGLLVYERRATSCQRIPFSSEGVSSFHPKIPVEESQLETSKCMEEKEDKTTSWGGTKDSSVHQLQKLGSVWEEAPDQSTGLGWSQSRCSCVFCRPPLPLLGHQGSPLQSDSDINY